MPVESTVHPHIAEEMAHLFTAAGVGVTEEEYLGVLTALVRACKPNWVLETGTLNGDGTLALIRGMNCNRFGSLLTVDTDAKAGERMFARVTQGTLDMLNVGFLCATGVDAIRNGVNRRYDFAFLDSDLPSRADELEALITHDALSPRAVVAIHDTSRCRTKADGTLDPEAAEFWARMERKVLRPFRPRAVLELPLSRGMCLIQI